MCRSIPQYSLKTRLQTVAPQTPRFTCPPQAKCVTKWIRTLVDFRCCVKFELLASYLPRPVTCILRVHTYSYTTLIPALDLYAIREAVKGGGATMSALVQSALAQSAVFQIFFSYQRYHIVAIFFHYFNINPSPRTCCIFIRTKHTPADDHDLGCKDQRSLHSIVPHVSYILYLVLLQQYTRCTRSAEHMQCQQRLSLT